MRGRGGGVRKEGEGDTMNRAPKANRYERGIALFVTVKSHRSMFHTRRGRLQWKRDKAGRAG